MLASATFTGETASGWQQVNFSKPVDDHRRHHLSRLLLRALRPLRHRPTTSTPRPPKAGRSSTARRCTRCRRTLRTRGRGIRLGQRRLHLRSTNSFPATSQEGNQLLGGCLSSNRTACCAGPGDESVCDGGDGSASLTWSAPSGGGAPTKYTITPYRRVLRRRRSLSGTPPATSATVTGLTAGSSYTFTVTASNSAGSGPASEPSNAVTPTSLDGSVGADGSRGGGGERVGVGELDARRRMAAARSRNTRLRRISAGRRRRRRSCRGLRPRRAHGQRADQRHGYTFKVSATNEIGEGPQSGASTAVTPTAAQDTIFGNATPATIDSGDGNSVELGVKFTSEVAGTVTGIRFYKASTNTGTHIGSLWTSAGTLLASATFTSETASGWQQVSFSTPVAIAANTTYVAALPGAERPLLRHRFGVHQRHHQPATDRRSPTAPAPTASTPTATRARSPATPSKRPTTGST